MARRSWHSEAHLAALGHLTVAYSALDGMLAVMISAFVDRALVGQILAADLDIQAKITKVRALVDALSSNPALKVEMKRWVDRARKQIERRNAIVHSWLLPDYSWITTGDIESPRGMKQLRSTARSRPFNETINDLPVETLIDIAEKLEKLETDAFNIMLRLGDEDAIHVHAVEDD